MSGKITLWLWLDQCIFHSMVWCLCVFVFCVAARRRSTQLNECAFFSLRLTHIVSVSHSVAMLLNPSNSEQLLSVEIRGNRGECIALWLYEWHSLTHSSACLCTFVLKIFKFLLKETYLRGAHTLSLTHTHSWEYTPAAVEKYTVINCESVPKKWCETKASHRTSSAVAAARQPKKKFPKERRMIITMERATTALQPLRTREMGKNGMWQQQWQTATTTTMTMPH